MIPSLQADKSGRLCPECGHALAVLDQKRFYASDDKHRFTCTNPKCDRFMRFTRPKRAVRSIDVQPLIRHF